MLAELGAVLANVPQGSGAGDYREAILQQNVLGKTTDSTRRLFRPIVAQILLCFYLESFDLNHKASLTGWLTVRLVSWGQTVDSNTFLRWQSSK